jgi:hypothetical protein
VVGTPVIGAWIAQLAFWILLVLGVAYGALHRRAVIVFVVCWLLGYVGLPRLSWWTGPLFTSWVAVLDIALVLLVFKSDVRLT